MTIERPARPVLATVICFYEVAIVVLVFLAWLFTRWFYARHPALPHVPTTLFRSLQVFIACALALVGAVFLWKMSRTAAYVMTARAVNSLVSYIYILFDYPARISARPGRHINPVTLHRITDVISLFIVLLNIAIAWYTLRVTSSERGNREAAEGYEQGTA